MRTSKAYLLLGIKKEDEGVISKYLKDYTRKNSVEDLSIYQDSVTGELVSVLDSFGELGSQEECLKEKLFKNVYSRNKNTLIDLISKFEYKNDLKIIEIA